MSRNLDLLRQNYCRPATDRCKTIPYLFPLERECGQGKALLASAPKRLLHFQEFDPCGLEQTYTDEATGMELPVFAIFNLAGSNRIVFEITAASVRTPADSASILAQMPFKKAQAFVRKLNERRIKTASAFTLIFVVLGIIIGAVCFFAYTGIAAGIVPWAVLAGSMFGGFVGYILAVSILDWRYPWQKVVIAAEFDGILSQRDARNCKCRERALRQSLSCRRPAKPMEKRIPPGPGSTHAGSTSNR